MRHPVVVPVAIAGLAVALTGCGGSASQAPTLPNAPVATGPDGRVTAQNSPPTAVFRTTPAASPADPGDKSYNPEVDGRITGRSPLDVTFNMCPSTDPDPGDALKFTYDFDGDGTVDERGSCRATHTYEAAQLDAHRGDCQYPEHPATVCVSDRQPFDGHTICQQYVVCATSGVSTGTFTFSNNGAASIVTNPLTSTIPVSGVAGKLSDVNVSLHILSAFDGDLGISVVSPAGTSVLISSGHGGASSNYGSGCPPDSVFDDQAGTAIGAASAPFVGSFVPDNPLSAFNGEDPKGNWSLLITDGCLGCDSPDADLQCWALTLTTQ